MSVESLIVQCEYISFDIFDTAVVRPFYNPKDLWKILNSYFEQVCQVNICFSKIRSYAEKIAREEEKLKEDITLDSIYVQINRIFGIPKDICSYLKKKECELEVFFASKRTYTSELYMYARKLNKKIIFISDMYLDKQTLKEILNKCGYTKYDKIFVSSQYGLLKKGGGLYKEVLKELGIEGDSILHIGDNEESDVKWAQENGLKCFFIPKTIDVFNNVIFNCDTNNCSSLAEIAASKYINTQFVEESIGFGAMISLVANRFFDYPFFSFHEKSVINGEPQILGYYLFGMFLLGVTKWIVENIEIKKGSYDKIVFLSRDGWVLKKVYDEYRKYDMDLPPSEYMYASREAILPMQIIEKTDFYDLPIEYWKYSPRSLLDLLNFCCNEELDENTLQYLNENDLDATENFRVFSDYIKFLTYFIKNKYNKKKHEKNKEIIKGYFSGLNKKSVIFDLGYSARVQRALAKCTGEELDVLFLYSDSIRSFDMERKGKLKIRTFYDFIPSINGIIREYLFSDVNATCIGYKENGKQIEPLFEKKDLGNWDTKMIVEIQNNALQFVKDFLGYFGNYLNYIPYKAHEVVLPLEGWLQIAPEYDRAIFKNVYSEDIIYGKNEEINMSKFLKNAQKRLPQMKDLDKARKKMEAKANKSS